MNSSFFSWRAFNIAVVAAFAAGCNGTQSVAASGLSASGVGIPQMKQRRRSWMLAKAKGEALVYVTGGCGGTCILSYPSGTLVGGLDVGLYSNAGVCTDATGNVYISNSTDVVEYAHGGTSVIATFNLPGKAAAGCSLDPTTGNLAVQFAGTSGNIAVFPKDSDVPTIYDSNVGDGFACAYDEHGNLFASGINGNQSSALTELAAGGSGFLSVSMPDLGFPGQIQWTGGTLAYEILSRKQTYIYRLNITDSTATVVGKTHLVGFVNLFFSWIYGSKILVPYEGHTPRRPYAQNLGVWKFPKGGRVVDKYKGSEGADFQSVVVSEHG